MKHSREKGDHHTHHLDDNELELGYSSDSSFENYYLYSKEELILVDSLKHSDFKYSGDDTRDRINISNIIRSAKKKHGCSVIVDDLCDMIMKVKRNRTMWKARNRTRFPKSRTHANNDQNTLPRKTTTTAHRRGGAQKPHKRRKPSAIVTNNVPEINPQASTNAENQENPQPQNRPIPPPPPPAQVEINPPARTNPENPQPENQPIPPPPARIHYFTMRELKNSDMRDNQCRLTMPEAQIVDDSFFTEEEWRLLKVDGSSLAVEVMDPRMKTWDSNLRYRKAGNTSHCYTMGKPWNELRRSNGFKERMVVHVGVQRRPDTGKLCIILQTRNIFSVNQYIRV